MTSVQVSSDTHLVDISYDDEQVEISTMEFALENASAIGYSANDWAVSHININVSQALNLITSSQLKIIDVREPWEYATNHIRGADLSPWDSNIFQSEYKYNDGWLYLNEYINDGSRGATLLVCRSGNRSTLAAEFLYPQIIEGAFLEDGTTWWRYQHTTVYNLIGGMEAWNAIVPAYNPLVIPPILSLLL